MQPLQTAIHRKLSYPEPFTYVLDITNTVLSQRLLLYGSKQSAEKETRALLKQAQKLLDRNFSSTSRDGLWNIASSYYAQIVTDTFDSTLLASLRAYSKASGKEQVYQNLVNKVSAAKCELQLSFQEELVSNKDFYMRHRTPIHTYMENITYKLRRIHTERNFGNKIVKLLFRTDTMWFAHGLPQALRDIELSYGLKLRCYLNATEFIYFKLVNELTNALVALQDPHNPYNGKVTIAQYFDALTNDITLSKSA